MQYLLHRLIIISYNFEEILKLYIMAENKLSEIEAIHYDKYIEVDECLDLNNLIWVGYLPFAETVGFLKVNLGKIKVIVQKIIGHNSSEFDSKNEMKKDLSTFTSDKCKIMLGYCKITKQHNLISEFNFKYSKLFKTRDNQLTLLCENIKDSIFAQLDFINDYEINASTITEFQQKITDFVNAKSSVVTGGENKEGNHNHLEVLNIEHERLLEILMDLVIKFKNTSGGFYGKYNSANRVGDTSFNHVSIYSNVFELVEEEEVPVAEATVIIELIAGKLPNQKPIKFEKFTNSDGYFRWVDLPSGQYKLIIKRFGLNPIEMLVDILEDSINKPNIKMVRA